MKYTTLVILALLVTGTQVSANEEQELCEWWGSAANVVAQNRDNGMEEYDLIGKYLSENKSYGEQSILIPIIDRVYGIESHLTPNQVEFTEKEICQLALNASGLNSFIRGN